MRIEIERNDKKLITSYLYLSQEYRKRYCKVLKLYDVEYKKQNILKIFYNIFNVDSKFVIF